MFAKLREKLKGWKTVAYNLMIGLPALLYALYLQLQAIDLSAFCYAGFQQVRLDRRAMKLPRPM